MEKTIRWGIAGTGNMAAKFAKDLEMVPACLITAVGSRDFDRASEFASSRRIENYYGSYGELFGSQEVDVVYIATPHHTHTELSIEAMQAGKHVLCEKPLAVNLAGAIKMTQVAASCGVFLMEALWTRFLPAIKKIVKRIEDGDIGKVTYLRADFGFYSLNRARDSRLLNPEMAGGSLLDIGIYPVFLAYLILGKPDQIRAVSNFYKTGVEIQTSVIFSYAEAQAVLYSGLSSKPEMFAEIAGTEGTLIIDKRWHETQGYTLDSGGVREHFSHPKTGKGYAHEIEEVNNCLRKGKTQSDLWLHHNSLDLIQLLDEIRAQSAVKFPFER